MWTNKLYAGVSVGETSTKFFFRTLSKHNVRASCWTLQKTSLVKVVPTPLRQTFIYVFHAPEHHDVRICVMEMYTKIDRKGEKSSKISVAHVVSIMLCPCILSDISFMRSWQRFKFVNKVISTVCSLERMLGFWLISTFDHLLDEEGCVTILL